MKFSLLIYRECSTYCKVRRILCKGRVLVYVYIKTKLLTLLSSSGAYITFFWGRRRAVLAAEAVSKLPETGPGCDIVRCRPD